MLDITVVPLVDGGGLDSKLLKPGITIYQFGSLGAEGLNYKDYEEVIATSDED